MRLASRLALLAATTVLAAGAATAPALAGGNGAQTFAAHAHGTAIAGKFTITFSGQRGLPTPPPPSGCWLPPTGALFPTSGNGVVHGTINRAGDTWFTTTYSGAAAAFPTSNGAGTPLATGHLTIHIGVERNAQNFVVHGALTFFGTLTSTGQPVTLTGHFQIASTPNSPPQLINASLTC